GELVGSPAADLVPRAIDGRRRERKTGPGDGVPAPRRWCGGEELTAAGGDGAPANQEEGHVGAKACGDLLEVAAQSVNVSQPPQGCRCIGASSTKAGSHRYPLDEPPAGGKVPAGPLPQSLLGPQPQVVGSSIEGGAWTRLDQQQVVERDRLEPGPDLVVAVRPRAQNGQVQVELGMRRQDQRLCCPRQPGARTRSRIGRHVLRYPPALPA